MLRSSIVGSYYRPARDRDALFRAKVGTPIKLVREPDNHFDGNAIRVFIGPHHVGYLSKMDAADYAPVFDKSRLREVSGKLLAPDEKYPRIEFELPADVYYSEFKK